MEESKPWRKPLQERQAYSEAMETDIERGDKLEPMAYGLDGLQMGREGVEANIYLTKSSSGPAGDTQPLDCQKISLQVNINVESNQFKQVMA